MKYRMEKLAELYIKEVIRLHGIPSSIVSDRDPRFTSRFWTSLHEALGTKLKLSSAYHPQTDGQTERTIQTLEDLLRACIIEQQGSWMDCLPLIEFTYNNSYQASIGMAPFEALYGRKCKTPICWYDDGEAVLLGPEMLQQINEQVKLIREKIKASQDRQKSYYDRRRKPLDFQEGEHVFLKVSPVTGVGRALKARKLTPKYLGPYQILKKIGPVAYQIALPPSLSNLHPVFHVSQLRRYNPDPSHILAVDEVQVKDNLTYKAQPQKITDRRMKSLRGKEIALVKVQWGTDEGDSTWELEDRMRELYPTPHKAPTFGAHFCSKSRKEGTFGVVKCVATSGTSKFQDLIWARLDEGKCGFRNLHFVQIFAVKLCSRILHKCRKMLLGRIDGDPVLRETRIWATWEYVSSVGEWYLEICRGGQETLGTSGGVLLPKTKLDQSRPNPGIVGNWEMVEASGNRLPACVIDYTEEWVTGNRLPGMCNRLHSAFLHISCPEIVMAAQLIRDRVEMECLEGAWETLEGNTRCRFRGTIRFMATSLVHPDEPARTLQRTVEWTAPWISFVYF
ncbi:Transposon Ty3-G Gag-Pol polyprotein [Glycine soja]|uniref:Transposon Ty3-G Gag-Pol polyprotein n=1 Tax=Glycine soja TaxID=3848 RepID=A0A445HR03_GLYSO|nr:Transposon Ty3-G Gag-Pol polyprotein [Glycine soja]